MRIASLLPGATEMICLLGLRDQLVGVAHECDFPPGVGLLPKLTRSLIPDDAASGQIDALVRSRVRDRAPLYQLDVDALDRLRPDLIVTQALCDVCAVDETEVRQAACAMPWGPRVLNLEPMSLPGVFAATMQIAAAAGVSTAGQEAVAGLQRRVDAVKSRAARTTGRPSVVFLEWLDPPFCGGHWNPDLVGLAGGRECIGRAGQRSRRIGWDQVAAADPDVIAVACCGFTIDRAKQDIANLAAPGGWTSLRAVRTGRVLVADGSAYFNRPGPRLVDSLELLARFLARECPRRI